MSKYATKEQLISIVQDMASKISVPTIGIGGGYAPIGTVISYMGVTAPQDYLACDGSTYNISAYSDLADFFQAQFGSKNYFGGDGVTTFGVPTLTGAPTSSIYCIKAVAVGYSTDEHVVSKWIDGKDVYEKTWDLGSDVDVVVNNWTRLNAVVIPNLGLIVGISATSSDGSIRNGIYAGGSPLDVFVFYTTKIRYVTVRYTKTTD